MKTTEVKELTFAFPVPGLDAISAALEDQAEKHKIDVINWKGYSYKPEVNFFIAYGEKELYLKYIIAEDCFKAEKIETNQMVCEDSCVEFFVSPGNDGIYYNFEFNGIGTVLLGTGTCRENSTCANPEIISKIRRKSSVGVNPVKEKSGRFEWNIVIAIPFEVFFHHRVEKLCGKTFRANFYKCGDMLSMPHYITWNPVETKNPDYHQPSYFGILKFV
ncbi:MAG: hypothetical protein LBV26_04200 [Bacteroidales bacterium]|jgi:hypothetical protein|nr:hypothetical protein [Bacteroidales bacterium]